MKTYKSIYKDRPIKFDEIMPNKTSIGQAIKLIDSSFTNREIGLMVNSLANADFNNSIKNQLSKLRIGSFYKRTAIQQALSVRIARVIIDNWCVRKFDKFEDVIKDVFSIKANISV